LQEKYFIKANMVPLSGIKPETDPYQGPVLSLKLQGHIIAMILVVFPTIAIM
tara:strand:- start:212 stop:367 length:156 start_codon:yes stop_codon:yes gene_type:complete